MTKVLHIPHNVGGNAQGLSNALNMIGIESKSWVLRHDNFHYPADHFIEEKDQNFIFSVIKRIFSLVYIFKFDVIFFNNGSTLFKPSPSSSRYKSFQHFFRWLINAFFQRLEFILLRFFKRIIIVQYQGDDARQGDYCLDNFEITAAAHVEPGYYTVDSDLFKRQQIALFDKYCHKIYALNPDLLHVLPRRAEFLPYCHIDLNDWIPVYTQMQDRPLRIGHAPSHRGVKGTSEILAAVNNLINKGCVFEFVLIEGLTNQQARDVYKTIDILIDQIFIGWYGGVAVECMALGKVVLAYIRESDLSFIPEQMRSDLPIININPSNIEQALERVVNLSRKEILNLAKRSRSYVEVWHNPVTIARRIENDLRCLGNKNI